MASVGVRELRQRASELLRRVEQGESIAVTDRGRPVAILSPPPTGSAYDRLLASGDLQPARADFADLPEPLVPGRGAERPSDVLRRLRQQER
jgi:prevent-host-death family protein